ncbi:MAG: ATP-binding cassette domain-containing protein [Hyphomicrobiaceae bacterium]|nr:ATP-binding cassette domain-containing protein [Hyphomicrobiaceae bacterium]
MRTSRRLLKQVRAAMLTAFFFGGFINMLMLTIPLYTLQVFETVVPLGSIETLIILTVITAAAIFSLSLIEIARDTILLRAGLWIDHCLGSFILENGLRVGVSGDELKRDVRALEALKGFVTSSAVAPLLDGPWVPIFLVALTLLHPMIGAMALIVAVVLFATALLQLALTDRLQKEATESRERSHQWFGMLSSAAPLAGALGLAPGVRDRWERANRAHVAGAYSIGKRTSFIKAISRSVRLGSQIAVYGLGAWLVVNEQITPGALVASAILLARALAPLEQLSGAIKPASAAWRGYQRLKALPAELAGPAVSSDQETPQGFIRLIDATVYYPHRRTATLRGISLDIAPGECVGIVGPNGAGKSTLAALVAGAISPTAGAADLDGLPISRWQRATATPPIGYLPDDPQLIEGTVHENIVRFTEASLMSAAAAAIAAGMHERIQSLADGYETRIGHGGNGLSLSERRAVGLARAFHGAPRMVVLDEPEAGLDGATFRSMVTALVAMKQAGHGLVIATQDARLLKLVDRVVVLAGGAVSRTGSPDQVLRPTATATVKSVRSAESAAAAPHDNDRRGQSAVGAA